MSKGKRYTVCVDFDGVIHSYESPWVSPHVIPDAPVSGALEWLLKTSKKFDIAILSTRCKTWRGRRAMRRYLIERFCALAPDWESTPEWLRSHIAETAFADPWPDEVEWAVRRIVDAIAFPTHKPPALVYLDDRAMRFTGPDSWPTASQIHQAKPWNKE